MKAIIIKINDKVVACEQLSELTSKQFLDLRKEAHDNEETNKLEIAKLLKRISDLELGLTNANQEIENLKHEIAIDRGEEDEFGEPPVSEEEDAYFTEKEESEEHE